MYKCLRPMIMTMRRNLTVPAEDSLVEAVDRIANKAGMTRTAYLRAIVKYAIDQNLEPIIEEVVRLKEASPARRR